MSQLNPRRRFCLALAGLVGLPWWVGAAEPEPNIQLDVVEEGDGYRIDARAKVSVPPAEAWGVLTDFDHMASFLPNLVQSKVTARNGNLLTVAQQGVAKVAGMSFPYETVRQVELKPFESVKTRLVSGNMKKMNTVTVVRSDGPGSHIHFSAEAVPDFWIPPMVGPALMRAHAESQFAALMGEIQRRHG